mgnify:CR=1 FL=1
MAQTRLMDRFSGHILPKNPSVTPQMLHATQVVFPMSSKKGCENFLLVLLWQPCNFQTITEMGKNFTR